MQIHQNSSVFLLLCFLRYYSVSCDLVFMFIYKHSIGLSVDTNTVAFGDLIVSWLMAPRMIISSASASTDLWRYINVFLLLLLLMRNTWYCVHSWRSSTTNCWCAGAWYCALCSSIASLQVLSAVCNTLPGTYVLMYCNVSAASPACVHSCVHSSSFRM